MIAEALTIPLDTAKVRLQAQRRDHGAAAKYRGPLQTVALVVREEGYVAPFRGLTAGCHRMFIFTGLRLGLLDHMKALVRLPDGTLPLGREAAAALMTSAVGITCANPSDVTKVRYQNGTGSRYSSVLGAYGQIAREEGVIGGLWKGYAANLVRNCTISAVELVGYSQAKQGLTNMGLPDNAGTHCAAGLVAGFLATVLGSSADVVGTRIIATHGDTGSLVGYCMNMLRSEGPLAFYRGFVPNFARIGSYNMLLWFTYEQLKQLMV